MFRRLKTTWAGSISSCEARHAARCSTNIGAILLAGSPASFFRRLLECSTCGTRFVARQAFSPRSALQIGLQLRADRCRGEPRSSPQASPPGVPLRLTRSRLLRRDLAGLATLLLDAPQPRFETSKRSAIKCPLFISYRTRQEPRRETPASYGFIRITSLR